MRGFVPAQEYDEEVRVLSSREIEITCSLANTFTVLNPPAPSVLSPFYVILGAVVQQVPSERVG